MATQLDPLTAAGDLLYRVTTEGDDSDLRSRLATMERSRLGRALSSPDRKLAFWLNCYNAYVQLLDEAELALLEGGPVDRWRLFARERVPVSGEWLSLADVEHGMLRGSKLSWGFGYLPRPFPSTFERRFRVERVDPRIHFALHRGSPTCPPVTVYSASDVRSELEVATEWFLEENVTYDRSDNVVRLPRLFLRYRGDFAADGGVRTFLDRYGVIPDDASPALDYVAVDRADAGPIGP